MILPDDPLSKQILELESSKLAYKDTLYFLKQMSRSQNLDVAEFLNIYEKLVENEFWNQ